MEKGAPVRAVALAQMWRRSYNNWHATNYPESRSDGARRGRASLDRFLRVLGLKVAINDSWESPKSMTYSSLRNFGRLKDVNHRESWASTQELQNLDQGCGTS